MRAEIRKAYRHCSVELELLTDLPFAPPVGAEMGFVEHADFWCDAHRVERVMWSHARGVLVVELEECAYPSDASVADFAAGVRRYLPGFRVRLQWGEPACDVDDLFDDAEADLPGESVVAEVRGARHLVRRPEYEMLAAMGEDVRIVRGEWKAKQPGEG